MSGVAPTASSIRGAMRSISRRSRYFALVHHSAASGRRIVFANKLAAKIELVSIYFNDLRAHARIGDMSDFNFALQKSLWIKLASELCRLTDSKRSDQHNQKPLRAHVFN
jgi:hypothetical protein